MTFADRLNILFQTRGKTLTAVSDEIGIRPSTLSRYLRGLHEPDYSSLQKLAAYFNVSMDWLGGLVDDKHGTLADRYKEVSVLYASASESDKKIIDLILDKYKTP